MLKRYLKVNSMSGRQNVTSGAPWESIVGYCRAVRVGAHIAVTGTASVGANGEVYAVGDAYGQARRCIEIIEKALSEAGAGLGHVVRTRIFVTDITQWEAVGRAHAEAFGDIQPATTMVQVSALIDPDMLVEIEADAIVGEQPKGLIGSPCPGFRAADQRNADETTDLERIRADKLYFAAVGLAAVGVVDSPA